MDVTILPGVVDINSTSGLCGRLNENEGVYKDVGILNEADQEKHRYLHASNHLNNNTSVSRLKRS